MRRPVKGRTGCYICEREIEHGAEVAWRGHDFHARCLVTSMSLFSEPGSAERQEISELVVPA